jgi:hypothetical protein
VAHLNDISSIPGRHRSCLRSGEKTAFVPCHYLSEVGVGVFSKDLKELSRFDNPFLFLPCRLFMGRPSCYEIPKPQVALQSHLDSLMVPCRAHGEYLCRKEWFVIDVLDHGIREVENGLLRPLMINNRKNLIFEAPVAVFDCFDAGSSFGEDSSEF